MSRDDFKLPELPSDEELGIAGLSEDDLLDDTPGDRPRDPTPPPEGPPPGGGPGPRSPSAGSPPARSRWRGPVTLALLVGLAWAGSAQRSLPRPGPANAPDTAFSSGRAMATLVEVARAPHVVGSPEHARVRGLIVDRLEGFGLAPEIQTTTSVLSGRESARAATVRNIVARVPGTASTGTVLLTAHYDAVPLSSGAGDDGTGVVTILETVRALREGPALRNDLVVLITDAEELGLLGARAFVDEHALMSSIRVVLSVEMRGGGGPSIMFETGHDNGWIVRAFGQAAPRPFANALSVELYRRLPNDTDFTPFRDAGVQGLNFAAIGRANIYHQATDVPANIQEATLQHHGVNLLAVTRRLGNADLGGVHAPDRAYLTLPGVGLVSHPPVWSMIAGGALALLFGLVFLLVRARGGRAAGVGLGALVGLAAAGGTSAAGYGLFHWVRRFHPEYGALVPAFHEEGWYVLALAAVALTLVTTFFGLARRRYGLGALALGATLVPLLAAVAFAFVAPLAAPNLVWPVGAALLAAGLAGSSRAGSESGIVVWVGALLLAAPVLAVLVPLVELIWVAMSFALAPILGALIATTLLLVLPALDGLAHPNRWWAPVTGLVLAAGFVATGVVRAGAEPDRPAPSTLVYVLDRDEGTSRWASAPDGGLAWARQSTGTELADEGDLSAFRREGAWFMSAAPAVDAPPPEATVRSDTTLEGRRHVVVALDAPLGAEGLTFTLPEASPWTFVAVNGHPVPPTPGAGAESAGTRILDHWGVPADTLTLGLEAPAGVALPRFWIVEQMLRPGALVGDERFQRPDTLVANAGRGSDRALIRTPVRLAPEGPEPLRTDSTTAPVPDTGTVRPPPDTTGAADTTGLSRRSGSAPTARRTPHPMR